MAFKWFSLTVISTWLLKKIAKGIEQLDWVQSWILQEADFELEIGI